MAPVSSMPFPCRGHAVPHGPRGPHPPPGEGGISGVARDVATCAAEAMCVKGGGVLRERESGGRGPAGSDITPVPLSPPTPLKNPEPVSLPPSRQSPPTPPTHCFPSKPTGPTTDTALLAPRLAPFSPSSLPSSTLGARQLLACAYPRSQQVGSRLRSLPGSVH